MRVLGGISLGLFLLGVYFEACAPDWFSQHPFLGSMLSEVIGFGFIATTMVAMLLIER